MLQQQVEEMTDEQQKLVQDKTKLQSRVVILEKVRPCKGCHIPCLILAACVMPQEEFWGRPPHAKLMSCAVQKLSCTLAGL